MNVIILTTGISGSSVITGLLAKAGLWAGDETVFKDNITGTYETFENKKLVELDELLIKSAGLEYDEKARYDEGGREKFHKLYNAIDISRYQDFITECNLHSPWIWKDPRLFLTIGFWINLIDKSNTKVIVLHRNVYELWKSQAIKRVIYSYRYLRNSEYKTRHDLLSYLEDNQVSYMSVEYDQFVKKPSEYIDKFNNYLSINLKTENWGQIYRPTGRFYQYKRTFLALLIYLKNYNSRIK